MSTNNIYPPAGVEGAVLANSEINEKISSPKAKINERCLNTHTPISRLPPELLSYIFKFYMDSNPVEKPVDWEDYFDASSSAYWYAYRFLIAQVSHHWRQVALQTPCLWAEIVMTSLECFKEMLVRSKEAPLAIICHILCDGWEMREIMGLLVSELHRIQELVLTAPKHFLQTINRECNLPRNATQLRMLHVADCDEPYRTFVRPIPFISTWSLPQLQELEIEGYALSSFQMLLPPSLTSLNWFPSTSHTVGHLLDLLQRTPQLRTLVINDPLCKLESETLDIHVKLSHLQHLRVDCRLAACTALVNYLEFPKDIEVHLHGGGAELSPDEEIAGLQALSTVVCKSFTPNFLRSFDISPFEDHEDDEFLGIIFRGWSTVLPHELPGLGNPDPKPHLQLTFSDFEPIEKLVGIVCSQLPLSNVDYLRVNHSDHYVIRAWRDAFYRMVNLTKLQVWGNSADVLPQALHITDVPMASTDGVSGERMKLFPRLAFLRLQEVHFVEPAGLPPTEGDFISRLKRALKDRCAHGYVLVHLDIWPMLSSTHEHILKEVVKKMTYEGAGEGRVSYAREDAEAIVGDT
ncbi:hypothetical protein NEOLEDRAFT_1244610 [Neolentinus lepideus HHB14362 ss-1]|uniref:Uncharacterized protein n=1 Tax=Neolentinus lepideus HHB14362 ss-1 TaxID=1314782 RepID=A0A165PRQ6_9AGAM|nr:hypothetical protein NEOLEDRAFT_1244610 [Neolentinus lepideus HHB14362 ss-1]